MNNEIDQVIGREITLITTYDYLTVRQFQALHHIYHNDPSLVDANDKLLQAVLSLYDITLSQFVQIKREDPATALKLVNSLSFLESELPSRTATTMIKVNGRSYGFVLNAKNETVVGNYNELMKPRDVHQIVQDMHIIGARLAFPVKKNWLGKWKAMKPKVEHFKQYEEDMKSALAIDIYSVLQFYYNSFITLAEEIHQGKHPGILREAVASQGLVDSILEVSKN